MEDYTANGIRKIIHRTWRSVNVPEKLMKSRDGWHRFGTDLMDVIWTDIYIDLLTR